MSAPIVFFDIAGPDDASLRAFYEKVFDWPCGEAVTFAPGNSPKLDGTIRKDPAEKVLYIGVGDVSQALKDIVDAGGTVDVDRYEVAGVAVLGLFKDPAGNRMGLVEMLGDTPKIP